MEEKQNTKVKHKNYSAIADMASTEGWKEIQQMLEYDVRFAQSLLGRPKPQKVTVNDPNPEPLYITDQHEIGRARGILSNAQKYLDLIQTAYRRRNLEA